LKAKGVSKMQANGCKIKPMAMCIQRADACPHLHHKKYGPSFADHQKPLLTIKCQMPLQLQQLLAQG